VAQKQDRLLFVRIRITAQMNETKLRCTCSQTDYQSRKRHCLHPAPGPTNPEQKIVEEDFRFRAETASGSTGARPGKNLLAPVLMQRKTEKTQNGALAWISSTSGACSSTGEKNLAETHSTAAGTENRTCDSVPGVGKDRTEERTMHRYLAVGEKLGSRLSGGVRPDAGESRAC
jgi:hypothetical protein